MQIWGRQTPHPPEPINMKFGAGDYVVGDITAPVRTPKFKRIAPYGWNITLAYVVCSLFSFVTQNFAGIWWTLISRFKGLFPPTSLYIYGSKRLLVDAMSRITNRIKPSPRLLFASSILLSVQSSRNNCFAHSLYAPCPRVHLLHHSLLDFGLSRFQTHRLFSDNTHTTQYLIYTLKYDCNFTQFVAE